MTGLVDSNPPRLPRLSEVLVTKGSKTFDSFAALPSNMKAVESTRLFASRKAGFVALIGPSGCGKSHLLESASTQLQSEFLDASEVIEAEDWAANPSKRDPHAPLIIDNVQDALGRSRVRLQLRMGLERRVRAGRPILLSFTTPKQSRVMRSFLPGQKDWIVCGITSPDPSERQLLVLRMAEAEGLKLCDTLTWLLAHRLHGNGCSLVGALKRLRLHHTQWTDPAMVMRACGVLNPYFADNSSWDLREHVSACAQEFPSGCFIGERQDLALFAMLRIALLAEADVAAYFDIEPAAAFNRAIRFGAQVSDPGNPTCRDEAIRFLHFAIDRLRH